MTDHAALDLLSDVLIHHGARLCSRCREAGCCVADRRFLGPHAGGNVRHDAPGQWRRWRPNALTNN
jgi:hypothetical protein